MLTKSTTLLILVTLNIFTASLCIDFPWNTKRCPAPKLFEQLDVHRFVGKWYNHVSLPNMFEKGKCGTTNYYYDATNTTLYNIDKELRGDKWVNSPLSTVTNDKPGVLTAHMFLVSADLNVLETDYDTYAFVYSCQNLYIVDPLRFAWILTRNSTLSVEEKSTLYSKAEKLFNTADILLKDLEPITQDCAGN